MEEKSQNILDYIIAYKISWDGLGPTLQEIADALGYPKPTVTDHVKRLVIAGTITRVPGRAGGIMVTRGKWTCAEIAPNVS